jgi:hypothetical protein
MKVMIVGNITKHSLLGGWINQESSQQANKIYTRAGFLVLQDKLILSHVQD